MTAIVRVVPYASIQFSVHERLKIYYDLNTYEQKLSHPGEALMAGAISSLVAVMITYPLDAARARLMVDTSYLNLRDVFRKSFDGEKPHIYKGFVTSAVGVVPYTAVSFAIFEIFKTRFMYKVKLKRDKEKREQELRQQELEQKEEDEWLARKQKNPFEVNTVLKPVHATIVAQDARESSNKMEAIEK